MKEPTEADEDLYMFIRLYRAKILEIEGVKRISIYWHSSPS